MRSRDNESHDIVCCLHYHRRISTDRSLEFSSIINSDYHDMLISSHFRRTRDKGVDHFYGALH
jgi:hypothetical protein